ncbi:hypothetical protein PSPO01_01750 [Paraphaeosphaeria sporulosa]
MTRAFLFDRIYFTEAAANYGMQRFAAIVELHADVREDADASLVRVTETYTRSDPLIVRGRNLLYYNVDDSPQL